MTEQAQTQAVVVGINGSQAAIDTASWAVAEAVSRGGQPRRAPTPRIRHSRHLHIARGC